MPDSANITNIIIIAAIEKTDSAVHTYLDIFFNLSICSHQIWV